MQRDASFLTRRMLLLLFTALSLFLSVNNFELFHNLAELFTVVVSMSVFIVLLNIDAALNSSFFVIIGISYGFGSAFDLLHTLNHPTMGASVGTPYNTSLQMWVIKRYMDSISLIAAAFFINKPINAAKIILFYFTLTCVLLLSVFQWNIFPDCYVLGIGMTPFKTGSEYIICVLLIIATVLLIKNRREFHQKVYYYLLLAYITSLGTDLFFIPNVSDYFVTSNRVGHLFKLASYYFLYRAIIYMCLKEPYNSLFFELTNANKQLQEKTQRLEYLSFHDTLTGAYNRAFFEKKISEMRKEAYFPVSIIAVDVDGLKAVNDALGHEVGDKLLINLSQILHNSVGDKGFVTRCGGDEFCIILSASDKTEAREVVKEIHANLEQHNTNSSIPVYASIGSASGMRVHINNLVRLADREMYVNKTERQEEVKAGILDFIIEYQIKRK